MEAKKTYTVKDVIIFLKDMRADNKKRLNDMYVEQVKLRGEFDTLKKVAENKDESLILRINRMEIIVDKLSKHMEIFRAVCSISRWLSFGKIKTGE